MKKLILSIIIGVASFTGLFGQNTEILRNPKSSVRFFTSFNINAFNHSAINKRLQEVGIRSVSPLGVSAGFGVSYSYKRMGLGMMIEQFGGSLSNNRSNDLHATYSGNHFFLSYELVRKKSYLIVPQVGYSAINHAITVLQKTGSIGFNQGLSSGNAAIVYNSAAMLNIGVGILKYEPVKRYQSHQLKVGYNIAFKSSNWQMLNATATNAPADNLSYFYIQYGWGLALQR